MGASIIKRNFLQCLFKDDKKVIYLILLSVKTEKNSFSPVTFRLEFILNLLNFYTDFCTRFFIVMYSRESSNQFHKYNVLFLIT